MSVLIIPCYIKTQWDIDCLNRLFNSVQGQTQPPKGRAATQKTIEWHNLFLYQFPRLHQSIPAKNLPDIRATGILLNADIVEPAV